MRYQERIYIQTPISCVRNKDHVNVSMSSDICIFNDPKYTMTGANKIVSGITVSDDEVHIIDIDPNIDLTFIFTGNTDSFIDNSATFKYDIYKFTPSTNTFNINELISSDSIEFSGFSGTSAFTDSIDTNDLLIDGEYLVKGSYDFNVCTEIMNQLGETVDTSIPLIGDEYGIYDSKFDFYFAAINAPPIPQFGLSNVDNRQLGSLIVESFVDFTGTTTTEVEASFPWAGDIIVALNGLTFAEDEDFVTIGQTIIFNGPLDSQDIVTLAYVGDAGVNGLVVENIIVENPIVSGTTDNEGDNLIYYNTDTLRFESYTLANPIEFNDLIITLNGVTLANGIDYYQHETNLRRIVYNSSAYDAIIADDIITTVYNSYGSYVGVIQVEQFPISWTVVPPPSNVNGQFIIEFATDDTFSTIIFSGETPYIIDETVYSFDIDLTGYGGTSAVYRVLNEKRYQLIMNEITLPTVSSEEIPIEINI